MKTTVYTISFKHSKFWFLACDTSGIAKYIPHSSKCFYEQCSGVKVSFYIACLCEVCISRGRSQHILLLQLSTTTSGPHWFACTVCLTLTGGLGAHGAWCGQRCSHYAPQIPIHARAAAGAQLKRWPHRDSCVRRFPISVRHCAFHCMQVFTYKHSPS